MKKTYSYTIRFTSEEEKDRYSDIIPNPIYNQYLARFGLRLWECRMNLTSEDLVVLRLKAPDLDISRTYLSKKEKMIRALKDFGIEV